MSDKTVIGIDIGTTAIKAVLVTGAGTQLGHYVESYPTARPAPGIVEQEPDDWIRVAIQALAGFERDFDLGGLQAIGICSQANTHVFIDRNATPLAPAIVWQDLRCADIAAELDGQVGAESRIAWWGAPLPIDASHCLSRMEWMRRNRPDIWGRSRAVILPKDYCIARLTGEVAADAIASIGLVDGQLNYIKALLDLVPDAVQRLPPLRDFTHVVGRVLPGLPCAGTPVIVGTMDAWSGMFGVDVGKVGSAMYLSGTSDVLGIVSPKRVPTPGVAAFPTYQEITLHAAPIQSGGASLAWLSRLLGRSIDELCVLAAAMSGQERIPLFIPHLDGERAPLWDPFARGIFLGLDSSMGPAHLVRSVMEGVAYSAQWALETLERSADSSPSILNCGGGGFASDVWNQIRADVLGRTLRCVRSADAAATGAAAMALAGIGAAGSIADAASRIVQFEREFRPDPARRGYHEVRMALFKDSYAATQDISRRHVTSVL
ncbi:xylulokinase [Rhizobium mongolense]|uniref:Xylulokinase n=2 Tax=Rhizobium mongolense TaxID=57676 RepID=A0ABR6ILK4_9HYPH|nr:FGGY family carbohydrate kinase [Rhizobium mongolense]MBB4228763.1 xylulokinase [Rhizobium mongolense]TVZ63651.1 xylulokinase [Rhizobium mongolense USDA 1844]